MQRRKTCPDSAVMVHETYDQLGIAANDIARHLRGLGYWAQTGHPLGGLAPYPLRRPPMS